MAVAAYASLVSLTHVLDNLHYRAPFQLPRVDIKQIETLQEKVQYLLEFVEHHSERKSPKIQGLWRQISEAAFEAEDRIDFHVVNLLYMRSQEEISDADAQLSDCCKEIERVISKTDVIKQDLLCNEEEEEEEGDVVQVGKQPTNFVPANGSFSASSSGKNAAVGIEHHVVRIMDLLTRSNESDLQTLPIVGMGGIGKTTLATTVFDRKYIMDCFDIRLWVTISQEYRVEQALTDLLGEEVKKGTCASLVELGDRLHKRLFGRKYLIVMDDVWTSKVCDEIKRFFPNNKNGSRILLTTRLTNVAILLGTHNPYSLSFLGQDESWDLFCETTFGKIGCPYDELTEIGRDIAKNCRGLPLEIVVIGRLLANSNMTREFWEYVAKNMNSLSTLGNNEHCRKTLSLSYENLSIHLKPCFLYMRVYPEDDKVPIYNLIDMWITEGYIPLVSNKSMEETADEYFKELIDRNMIFRRSVGEFCGIHDLLRDLCLRESNIECFIRSPKVHHFDSSIASVNRFCFLCGNIFVENEEMDLPTLVHIFPLSSQVSPSVCNACDMLYSHIKRPRWVTTVYGFVGDSRKEIMQPFGLRYATMMCTMKEVEFVSPSRVHLLWNLQTLRIYSLRDVALPPEIWEMPQLRVIDCSLGGLLLPDPVATHIEGEDFIVLKNLHTLCYVYNFKCTKEVLDRVPNLKKLKFVGNSSNHSLCNLEQLQKLESLKVENAMENISFPNSLKSLTLAGHYPMVWEEMSIFGSLPNLEELVLELDIQGSEWNPVEGEFLQLKVLLLQSPDLVWWRAGSVHFPVLEDLHLNSFSSLEEIPSGIGDIPTLRAIHLSYCCNDAVNNSGKQILEEQQDMGNETLKLYIDWKQIQISPTESDDSDS